MAKYGDRSFDERPGAEETEPNDRTVDSTSWTGRGPEWLDVAGLTQDELNRPMIYRHTAIGDRRLKTMIVVSGGLLVLIAVGTILTWTQILLGWPDTRVSTRTILAAAGSTFLIWIFAYAAYNLLSPGRRAGTGLSWRWTRVGDPVLTIDNEGFEDLRQPIGRVPWSAVKWIDVSGGARYGTVTVDLKDSPEHRHRYRNGKLVRSVSIVLPPMEVESRRLANIMEARRRAAVGERQGPS